MKTKLKKKSHQLELSMGKYCFQDTRLSLHCHFGYSDENNFGAFSQKSIGHNLNDKAKSVFLAARIDCQK